MGDASDLPPREAHQSYLPLLLPYGAYPRLVVWGKGVAASRHRRLGRGVSSTLHTSQCARPSGAHLDGRRQRRRSQSNPHQHPAPQMSSLLLLVRVVLLHHPRRPVSGTAPVVPLTSPVPSPPPAPAQPHPGHAHSISSVNQPVGQVHCSEPTAWLLRALSLVSSNQSTLVLLTTPSPPGCDRLCDHLSLLCGLRL